MIELLTDPANWLAFLTLTALELVLTRHWDSLEQIIPFGVLAIAAVALWLIAKGTTGREIWAARVLCAVVMAGSALGIWEHIEGNHESGYLDQRYSATWETKSAGSRWFLASTGGVGPAPVLAPGVLAQTALMLLGATLRHPAVPGRQREEDPA